MRIWLLFCSLSLAAQVELVSPLGRKFEALPDKDGAVAKADAALAAQPGNPELILAAAQARDRIWRYSESIALYGQGIKAAPGDFRFPRYRGHRYISTRKFDLAVKDLERAKALAPGSFDVAYHLGLAHYLRAEYQKAAAEYSRCLNMAGKPESAPPLPEGVRHCAELSADDNSRVALTEWLYRALRRAGRDADAERLLSSIGDEMKVDSNETYYESLMFYKGMRTEKSLLDPSRLKGNQFPTAAYAVANWQWLEGNKAKACRMYRQIVEDPAWNAFGYIAAEAELARGACKDEE
jgi:tetratricopeptide (TPR) repeat protein